VSSSHVDVDLVSIIAKRKRSEAVLLTPCGHSQSTESRACSRPQRERRGGVMDTLRAFLSALTSQEEQALRTEADFSEIVQSLTNRF
jgi:hypothetical protein